MDHHHHHHHDQGGSRRDLFRSVASSTPAAVAFVVTTVSSSAPVPANAMNSCPPRSSNCIRTTWKAPPGTSDVGKTLYSILQEYPQEGQADIDLGGWKIVSGDLVAGDTSTRIEYNSGVGKFAKFFNGGKPFIDDVDIEIVNNNSIEIRSSSRVGDSDFDVNKKRLQFLGNKARELGWDVPEPKY